MPWSRHLGEDRLFECYFASGPASPWTRPPPIIWPSARRCAARYPELTAFLDGLRDEAIAETDAVFTAERLQAQQQQIARRLNLLGHAARVITFPGRLAADASHAGRVVRAAVVSPRWLAAAAAAGLFVGAIVGSVYDFGVRSAPRVASSVRRGAARAPAPPAPPASLARPVSVSSDDDAFLSEIELALGGPRTRELLPFDAMTPRVQEISTRLR